MNPLVIGLTGPVVVGLGLWASAHLMPDQWPSTALLGLGAVGGYLFAVSRGAAASEPSPLVPAHQEPFWPRSYFYGLGAILVVTAMVLLWLAMKSSSPGYIPARLITQVAFLAGATMAVGLWLGLKARRFVPQ